MNNRQSGRRRGRNNNNSNNNNRPQSGGRGGVDQANRIDSRARGNGAQMIEKYRNLARDAQLAGDRVQTEYYLQFADHYFRVVSDFRLRQEEKNAQNGQDRGHDRQREIRGVEDFDGHDDSDLDMDADRDDEDAQIVRTIVALGQALHLTLVAEGIENEQQAELLRGLGCDIAQGYFYSRPLTETDLVSWLGQVV